MFNDSYSKFKIQDLRFIFKYSSYFIFIFFRNILENMFIEKHLFNSKLKYYSIDLF